MSSQEGPKPAPLSRPRSWRVRVRVLAAALGVALFASGQGFMAFFVLRHCVNGGPFESFRCQAPIVMLQLGTVLCLLTLIEVVISAVWTELRSCRGKMTPRRWLACLVGALLTASLQPLCLWLLVLAEENSESLGPLMFPVMLAWWCLSLPAIPVAGHGNWTLAYIVVFWGVVGAMLGARLHERRGATHRSGQG